jgi:hypothetical protein
LNPGEAKHSRIPYLGYMALTCMAAWGQPVHATGSQPVQGESAGSVRFGSGSRVQQA